MAEENATTEEATTEEGTTGKKPRKDYKYHSYKALDLYSRKYIDKTKDLILKVSIKATDQINPSAPNRTTLNTASYEILQGDNVLYSVPEKVYGLSFDLLNTPKINLLNEEIKNLLTDFIDNPNSETARNFFDRVLEGNKIEEKDTTKATEAQKEKTISAIAHKIVQVKKFGFDPELTEKNIQAFYNKQPDLKEEIEAKVKELEK